MRHQEMLRQILVDYLEKRLQKKIDTDLTALFGGFSTTAVGSATAMLTVAKFFQAVAKLRAVVYQEMAINAVLHPMIALI